MSSQDFEADRDLFDTVGADDFTLTTACTVTRVRLLGHYVSGQGPGQRRPRMHITFYEDAGLGMPGAPIAPFPVTVKARRASTPPGDLVLRLEPDARPALEPGTYWLSAQVRMDFDPFGEWAWSTTHVQSGDPAVWQNPGGKYHPGCSTWTVIEDCDWPYAGADFMFRLAAD